MAEYTYHQYVRTHELSSSCEDLCTFFEAVALGDIQLLQDFVTQKADGHRQTVHCDSMPLKTELLRYADYEIDYTPPRKQQSDEQNYAHPQVMSVDDGASLDTCPYTLDINVLNKQGETALMVASKFGRVAAVEQLLKLGSDVNLASSRGNALTYAAANGHKTCIRLLVKAGCNPNTPGSKWDPAVLAAARSGYTDCVRALLEAGADPDARNHAGKTALITATQWGHFNCAKTLIRFGANVNSMSVTGDTALKWAARGGNTSLVRLLVKSRAEVNTPSTDATTPLMFAAHVSAACVHELIGAGADLHARNTRGQVPLFWGVNSGDVEIVLALLTAGANVNAVSTKGHTPLFYSVKNGDDDMNKILIAAGANVNATDLKGKTPLLNAVQNYHMDCFKTLLLGGADVNIADQTGKSPLMVAVMGQFTGAFNDLLAAGALVNWKDTFGRTALMLAASVCSAAYCKELLAHGANVNEQDNEGVTALMYAAEKEIHCDSVKNVLLVSGADVNMVDLCGKTALMHAISYNKNLACLRFLTKDNALNHQNAAVVHCLESENNLASLDKAAVLLSVGFHPVLPDFYRPLLLQKFCFASTCRNKTYVWSFKKFILHGEMEMIRLFVSNGIVLKRNWKRAASGASRYSNIACALSSGHISLAKYLIANCYIFQEDLNFLRRFKSAQWNASEQGTGDELTLSVHKDARPFLNEIIKHPWPLVKLAFIAVSSLVGSSPERAERIRLSGLPPQLQALLNFQGPVSMLPVREWSGLKLAIDPLAYGKLPKQRPLLYFWPFGKEITAKLNSGDDVNAPANHQMVIRFHKEVSSDEESSADESCAVESSDEVERIFVTQRVNIFGPQQMGVNIFRPRRTVTVQTIFKQ